MSVRKIVFASVVGALYAALTMALGFISYGPIQFRLAEALCVLPFFFPFTSVGLFAGCFVANLLLSPYGLLDIVAGPIATLIAAMLTMSLGKSKTDSLTVKILACLPPVLVNALIIGAVISFEASGSGGAFLQSFAVCALQVGFGQLVVVYAIGLPLLIYLPKSKAFRTLSAYE